MRSSECLGYIMMYITKNCLSFFETSSYWYLQSIERNQGRKYFWIINRCKQYISLIFIILFYHFLCTVFSNTCNTFFFLSILLFTFIESILENVNDLVCVSCLSNESNREGFYENENETIETFIIFLV